MYKYNYKSSTNWVKNYTLLSSPPDPFHHFCSPNFDSFRKNSSVRTTSQLSSHTELHDSQSSLQSPSSPESLASASITEVSSIITSSDYWDRDEHFSTQLYLVVNLLDPFCSLNSHSFFLCTRIALPSSDLKLDETRIIITLQFVS